MAALGWFAAGVVAVVAGLLIGWRLGWRFWDPIVPWLHPQDRVLLPQMIALIGRPHAAMVALAVVLCLGLVAATAARVWNAMAVLVGAGLVVVTGAACGIVSRLESDIKSFAPFTARVSAAVDNEPVAFYQAADFAVLFYLRRHVPVQRGALAAMPRPGWGLVWQKDWAALPQSERGDARVMDESPPASVGRLDTRLLLVRIGA